MTLTELKYVIAVARERHFGRAAESCFVSQPSLSVAIKKLEEELGVSIFERRTPDISITPVGAAIIEQAQKVLEESRLISEIAKRGQDPLAGPIRLGMIYTVAPYLMPELIVKLSTLAPKMPVYLEETYTTELISQLRTGAIDVAIMADTISDTGFMTQALYQESFVVAVPSHHPWVNRNYIGPQELRDQTMLLRALAYKVHPYRWAAIGLTTEHIASASPDDVGEFYRTHYHPSNAILSISADMEEERMLELAEKWFGGLPDTPRPAAPIPQEPPQEAPRREEVERDVPATTVTVAYRMGTRTSPDFYTADLVSDLLSGGDSGRLYRHLVKERRLLSSVNAYVTGDLDPGLFVFTGQLLPGVAPEAAEAAFREEIEALRTDPISQYETEKVKNKFEANTLFGELNVMNKAMNLGFYEMLGDLPLINGEVARYRAVSDEDIRAFCRSTLRPENASTLIYKARK